MTVPKRSLCPLHKLYMDKTWAGPRNPNIDLVTLTETKWKAAGP